VGPRPHVAAVKPQQHADFAGASRVPVHSGDALLCGFEARDQSKGRAFCARPDVSSLTLSCAVTRSSSVFMAGPAVALAVRYGIRAPEQSQKTSARLVAPWRSSGRDLATLGAKRFRIIRRQYVAPAGSTWFFAHLTHATYSLSTLSHPSSTVDPCPVQSTFART
jgi:hypothetical protein